MADHSFPLRPPLTRGNTVPLYVRRDEPFSTIPEDSRLHNSQRNHPVRPPEIVRREQPPYTQSNPVSPIHPHHWQSASHPPTPPLSTSPGSPESEEPYSRGYMSSSSSAILNPRMAKPHSPYQLSSFQSLAPPMAPSVSTPPIVSDSSSLSFLRSSRAPHPQQHVKMRIESTPTDYILSAPVGPGFDSNCITIAARKGNVLDIVADRWELEKDCHYEWQVQFDRDADMSSIRASYTSGILEVTVKRVSYTSRDSSFPSCGRP